MSELAIDDPMQALRRVLARRHGALDRRQWPRAEEIRAALRDHQRLFRNDVRESHLTALRTAAREAMRFFAPFHPYLVGTVLDGTADRHSSVQLHLHADEDAVLRFLADHAIRSDVGEARIHLAQRGLTRVPRLRLEADGIGFELWLLSSADERQGPLEADGLTPMRRVTLAHMPGTSPATG